MAYQQQDDGMGFWDGVGATLGGSAALGAAGTLAGMTPMGRAGIRKAAEWAGRADHGPTLRGMQEPLESVAKGYDDMATGLSNKINQTGVVQRQRGIQASPLQELEDRVVSSLVEVQGLEKDVAQNMARNMSELVTKARGAKDPKAIEALEKLKADPKYGQLLSAMDEEASAKFGEAMSGALQRRGDYKQGMGLGMAAGGAGVGAGVGAYEMMGD